MLTSSILQGSQPGLVAWVAETPRWSVGPDFKLGRWSLSPCHPFRLSCEFDTATELVNTSSQTLSDTSKQDQNFRLISNTYISNSSDQLSTDHRSDTRWVGGWFVLKPSVRDNWIMASTLRSCSACLHCCVTQLQFCPFELLLEWYERYDISYLSKNIHLDAEWYTTKMVEETIIELGSCSCRFRSRMRAVCMLNIKTNLCCLQVQKFNVSGITLSYLIILPSIQETNNIHWDA